MKNHSKKLFRKTQTYLDEVSPNMASRLDYYKLKTPVFEGMGIEDEIAKLLRPKVWLKSGAYLSKLTRTRIGNFELTQAADIQDFINSFFPKAATTISESLTISESFSVFE